VTARSLTSPPVRLVAVPVAVLALLAFFASSPSQARIEAYRATITPLPGPMRARLADGGFWRRGCPVTLAQLRLLTVRHWAFDGRVRTGQLVVNGDVAAALRTVFGRLYALRFPIRHMRFVDQYGLARARPADNDVSNSFYCRQASASPCTGTATTGTWSNHAYGHAVDLNPVENPYIGCGATRSRASAPYIDRSRLRKGMVTPAVVRTFRSVGWGWGGAWTGRTKDYMHFSTNGH
jgi:D-alanyl-D-alanine carboxypeptidase